MRDIHVARCRGCLASGDHGAPPVTLDRQPVLGGVLPDVEVLVDPRGARAWATARPRRKAAGAAAQPGARRGGRAARRVPARSDRLTQRSDVGACPRAISTAISPTAAALIERRSGTVGRAPVQAGPGCRRAGGHRHGNEVPWVRIPPPRPIRRTIGIPDAGADTEREHGARCTQAVRPDVASAGPGTATGALRAGVRHRGDDPTASAARSEARQTVGGPR